MTQKQNSHPFTTTETAENAKRNNHNYYRSVVVYSFVRISYLKFLKLSGSESIHSSCYSEITDRGQKMTIFGKLAISPDEGPYRKN